MVRVMMAAGYELEWEEDCRHRKVEKIPRGTGDGVQRGLNPESILRPTGII